jgi:hypothetical protein
VPFEKGAEDADPFWKCPTLFGRGGELAVGQEERGVEIDTGARGTRIKKPIEFLLVWILGEEFA